MEIATNGERQLLQVQEKTTKKTGRANQGFGSMNAERLKKVSAAGGRSAHRPSTAGRRRAHEFTPETARIAGKRGLEARAAKREAEKARTALRASSTV